MDPDPGGPKSYGLLIRIRIRNTTSKKRRKITSGDTALGTVSTPSWKEQPNWSWPSMLLKKPR
jgi:hypothetical protein